MLTLPLWLFGLLIFLMFAAMAVTLYLLTNWIKSRTTGNVMRSTERAGRRTVARTIMQEPAKTVDTDSGESSGVDLRLRLDSGQDIALRRLYQTMTYAGFLEGVPTRRFNESMIQSLIAEGRECMRIPDATVCVIEPERRDYSDEPGDMLVAQKRSMGMGRPEAMPEFLPSIACIGEFRSWMPARDYGAVYSELIIAWFQDEFVTSPSQLERLRFVDWKKYATDCSCDEL